MYIKKNDLVLFLGDSITDTGREYEYPDDLGKGYVLFASSFFKATYPELDVEFINKGIGGNRTIDIIERLDTDCIAIKPDVVSLYVGVNDTLWRFKRDMPTSLEQFKKNYTQILERIVNSLNPRLIIIEPFSLMHEKNPSIGEEWLADLAEKVDVIRQLAKKFDARYLPLGEIFAEKCKIKDPHFWTNDGVHPSKAGHALITQKWLELINQ
jgi:lysophospholipase L1-like esterase